MNSRVVAAEAVDWKNSSSGTQWERFRDSGQLDSKLYFVDSPFHRWPLQISGLLALSVLGAAMVLIGPLRHPSQLSTQPGEQRSFTLADGSSVALEENSQLRVAFNEHERRVILARGAAHIAVAAEATRPFLASSSQMTLRTSRGAVALRTAAAMTEVEVLRGEAEILPPLLDDTPGARPESPQHLGTGDHATVNVAGDIEVRRTASD